MFAPRFVAGRWAAEELDSVMNVRGFAGQHIAIAALTLFSSRSQRLARPALLLNAGVEICDAVAGGFEVHERGTRDLIELGGVALPFVSLATWLSAFHKLGREQ